MRKFFLENRGKSVLNISENIILNCFERKKVYIPLQRLKAPFLTGCDFIAMMEIEAKKVSFYSQGQLFIVDVKSIKTFLQHCTK